MIVVHSSLKGECMDQLHKRFTTDQIKALLKGFCRGTLDRSAIEETLGISKTRFFALLRQYRHDPDQFALTYRRTSPGRLDASVEEGMAKELAVEKQLIEDPSLPINTYNYSAIRDRLIKREITVSLSTIIDRAKNLDCYQPRPRKRRTIGR